ncbi:MAG: hypothetical protein ABFD91_05445, partial [Anaerohalosphaeraceae bacterium]
METKRKTRGSWGIRLFIILLSTVFGVLFFWLLNFITKDIGTMEGPWYDAVRTRYVDSATDDKRKALQKEQQDIGRMIQIQREQQNLLRDSTSSLQNTMEQLLSLQKESLQKNVEFSEQSRQTLRESQVAFLENQKIYEQYNQKIAELTSQQRIVEDDLGVLNEKIKLKEQDAQFEFQQLVQQHKWKIAAIQLGILVPIFLAISWLFMKYRTSTYWAMVWAAFIAVFIKLLLVVNDVFPKQYFKYIVLLVVLAIVIRILIYLIRMIVSPKKELLIRQYQQDYDKHICPICSKPIRIGLLRYACGLRKKTTLVLGQDKDALSQQVYTCPSCGTSLYDKCDSCGQIRHTL